MADILNALTTMKNLLDNQADTEVKEFLRGTISIMDLKENCSEQLDELKTKFLKCRKDVGGLDIDEFEAAVTPLISKGISRNQILTTFQKMDPCDDGYISWNDFINFAIEEHNKRIQMRATMDEMPFSPEAFKKRHSHSDTFMSIAFMPTVDPVSLQIDWGNGKYAMLSREGVMSVWSAGVKNISYTYLSGKGRPSPDWHLDLVTMYHNGFVAVATTLREISFFDYNMQGWSKKYWLRNLEHCVTKMNYWAGLEKEKIAVLLWGDTSGSVVMLEFELSQRTPLFGIPVREHCIELSYSELVKGHYKGVTHRIFRHVHAEWVKQVRYMPKTSCVLSCCADTNTGLYMTPTEPTKRKACYFTTMKGILSFDYCQNINLVAAAGIDNNIWLYNPYVPHKVIAIMEGHTRPITHIKINEEENYLLSVDVGRNVLVFNLTRQVSIMRIPSQVLKMGFYPINAVYLNPERKMCLLGGSSLVILKRRRLEGLNVEVRSHDEKLVAALYSPPYEQVVSVCRQAVIRVWDINTGTRVMQFVMAHSKKVHGRMIPVEIECAALTDNKKRLFTAAEGIVKIWNFSCGVLLRVLEPCQAQQRINSIVVAKSIIYLTGWNKVITLYSDFKGEELVKKIWPQKHNEDCLGLCILEPNLIASFSYDGQIVVWSRETTDSYCRMSASFGHRSELEAAVTAGGKGANIMGADNMDDNSDDGEEEGEDSFMTIGKHLRKEGGWYRGVRAIKKRQIEREKRRAAKERKDFTAKFKKKKKRMNMQGLSLVYESAVECMTFLESRKAIDAHTATLVCAGAECWVRFWSLHPKGGLLGQFNGTRRKLESIRCMTTDSQNEYLLTGDTMGHLRIWDIKEFCNAVKLTPEERDARELKIRRDFVYVTLPFKPEEILDTMEKLRAMRISVPDASKPRKNLKSPRLLSSIRCHTQAIMTIELIEDRNLILTSSQDRTVRLWTKNCTYIGTFGEHWRPLPAIIGRIVEAQPRIPKDLLRCASARSLATLHNGSMPHWKKACAAVRRHIVELHRERQIEEAREKLKSERRARGEPTSDDDEEGGEKPASKVLGKYYQPKHRYKGPLNTQALGFPELKVFRDKCAPYSSIPPRDFFPLKPLYSHTTLIDVDSRRRKKSKRTLRQMLQQFSSVCGEGIHARGFDQRTTSTASHASGSMSEVDPRQRATTTTEISGGNSHSTPTAQPSVVVSAENNANRSNKPNKVDATWNRSPSPSPTRYTKKAIQNETQDTRNNDETESPKLNLAPATESKRPEKRVVFDSSIFPGPSDSFDSQSYFHRTNSCRYTGDVSSLDRQCEEHCYRERCGLPPLTPIPSMDSLVREESSNKSKQKYETVLSNLKPRTAGLTSSMIESANSRITKRLGGLSSGSIDGGDARSTNDSITSTSGYNRFNLVCSSPDASHSHSDIRSDGSRTLTYGVSEIYPSMSYASEFLDESGPHRSFLNRDGEIDKDTQSIDRGLQMYNHTRKMLEQAKSCLAIDPESEFLSILDTQRTDTANNHTTKYDVGVKIGSLCSQDKGSYASSVRFPTAPDDVEAYLARKERYAQAIKLNYKRND